MLPSLDSELGVIIVIVRKDFTEMISGCLAGNKNSEIKIPPTPLMKRGVI